MFYTSSAFKIQKGRCTRSKWSKTHVLSAYYYYNFEEHLVQKQEHFATSGTQMSRWLRPAGFNMLELAKMFIRARIIRHNARQCYKNLYFKANEAYGLARPKPCITTVIKHSGHLRTLDKCRKHSPAARVFYISQVFSNDHCVILQCNTRLRLLYFLNILYH